MFIAKKKNHSSTVPLCKFELARNVNQCSFDRKKFFFEEKKCNAFITTPDNCVALSLFTFFSLLIIKSFLLN